MNQKRILVAALLLAVVFMGCKKSSSTADTTSGNWVRRSELNGVARAEAVSFVVNDKAYVSTGFDGTKRLTDLWRYDSDSDYWSQKADFAGVARNSAVGFAVGSFGYVGTGYDGVNYLNDFWQYDPIKDAWAQKANFAGTARYDAVGFGILNKGYISTGFDGSYLKDFWSYDPATDSWTSQIAMGGQKRSGAVVFVYNNIAYITTGSNNGTNVNDLWAFDPSTSSWTQKRAIANVSTDSYDDAYNIIRTNAAAVVIGDKAFISTGNNNAFLNTTWVYDIANDLWSQKSNFEGVARDGAVGFTVKGRGYIATGRNSTLYLDDIWEFHPDETLNPND